MSTLGNEERSEILDYSRIASDTLQLKKGEILFREGDPSEEIFLIKEGKILLVKQNEDRIFPLALLSEKEILGEMGMFQNIHRSATAVVEDDALLVKIGREELEEALQELPPMGHRLIWGLISHLRKMGAVVTENTRSLGEDFSLGDRLWSSSEEVRLKNILAEKNVTKKDQTLV